MSLNRQASTNPRVPLIIECALSILRDRGDSGLTMRQVAAKAGISLSNLQFYFKNKNELLKGMVDFYFDKCLTLFDEHIETSKALSSDQKVRMLITFGLGYCDTTTEICKIFKELWAIATRNEEINAHLEKYYREYARKLSDFLSPLTVGVEETQQAVTLIIPYFEGYAIASPILPIQKKQVAELLTSILSDILKIRSGKTG